MNHVDATNKEKYDALNRLLEDDYMLVHLNSAAAGVIVPEHLRNRPSLTLRLSRFFRGFLRLERDKVIAQLLFGEEYLTCTIPMSAIWGATGMKGSRIFWPESAPQEALSSFLTPSAQAEAAIASKQDPEAESSEGGAAKRMGHLRRVK
jgi:hypothetical protein